MSTNSTQVESASRRFAQAIVDAHRNGVVLDDILGSAKINKLYNGLFRSLRELTEERFKYGFTVGEAAFNLAHQITESDADDVNLHVEQFANYISRLLTRLENIEWLAFTPLPWQYADFPLKTDFGPFQIINVNKGQTVGQEKNIRTFRNFLRNRLQIPVENRDNGHERYDWLGSHFFRKSDQAIPGRAMLFQPCGTGEEFAARRLNEGQLRAYLPLLELAEMMTQRHLFHVPKVHATTPGGMHIERGSLDLIPVSLAVEKNSGTLMWWSRSPQQFDASDRHVIDVSEFKKAWKSYCRPILELDAYEPAANFCVSIRNALSVYTQSRNAPHEVRVLSSIIAIETLQKPFGQRGSVREPFCMAIAHLMGSSLEERTKWYRIASKLYSQRSSYVHSASLDFGRESPDDVLRDAKAIFVATLQDACHWGLTRARASEPLDKTTHRQHYEKLILS
ncbi:HEPN domain-containing protein [Fimbriimonas ginsengisoli]|uniref:Uncharacterized protein n=1 Tax=Fimbriimonas ginsengisoli Gsoil 348 TaxID=661478 RepID=A0A068NM06_FIMGI|nr:HEPN domain-containing protein [Fimbriimonas ginsengisoli]AIE84558.1 hypothetical protein OP10G_1190 [Fimbriimonas ginsengisoli Gsoil 348]